MYKICPRCSTEKLISEFSKNKLTKDGLQSACKECKRKEQIKTKLDNPEKLKEIYQRWYSKDINKKKHYIRTKQYSNNHPEVLKKAIRKWKLKTDYDNQRYKNDTNFKIKSILRSRIYEALKGNIKKSSSTKLLGCSIQNYKKYIESQFKPEMNWNNWGQIWEIDHKLSCSNFNLSKLGEQKKCFNYKNTQPLFKTTKIAKDLGYDEIGNRNKYNKNG